jgi:hypothetical protein
MAGLRDMLQNERVGWLYFFAVTNVYLAILEDNAERRAAMADAVADRLPAYTVVFTTSSRAMNDWLERHLAETIAISLDHDLDFEPDATGKMCDAGTGREVADYLHRQTPTCPILIHSTNVQAATAMEDDLTTVGWQVARLTPYEDLLWVRELWLPTLRHSIVHFQRAL